MGLEGGSTDCAGVGRGGVEPWHWGGVEQGYGMIRFVLERTALATGCSVPCARDGEAVRRLWPVSR